MRVDRLSALIVAACCLPSSATAQSTASWGTSGSVATGALVGLALGLPVLRHDRAGDIEAAESLAAAFITTQGLKQLFPDKRPDGSDDKSFPSGHTSAAFAAAATLQNRYGWKIGLPAQLLAGFVAVSRTQARKHAVDDIAVGAAIGEVSGFLLTSKHDAAVRVVPWGGATGGGAKIALRF